MAHVQRTAHAVPATTPQKIRVRNIMGRRKPTTKTEFVLFNVTYEDGTVTSNRRAPGEVLESLEGEAAVEAFFSEQDREIAERSGKPRAPIRSIEQVKIKKLKAQGKSNSKAA